MILLGDGAIESMRRLAETSRHAAGIAETMVEQAEAIYRGAPIAYCLDPDRGTLLETSRDLGRRVFVLGIAWAVTGHAPFRNRIVMELQAAIAFPDWNRRHFLNTAEMAAAVAIGYDWSKAVMTRSERQAIAEGIATLGLNPGLASLQGGSSWTTVATNWTLVCSGGLIVAAALLRAEMTSTCDQLLDLALPVLQSGLAMFDDDGGWPEGHTYGEYGARYAIFALEALREAGLSARIPPAVARLSPHWRFQKAMIGTSGRAFNAGDGLDHPERSPVAGWFARQTGNPEAAAWQWETPGAPQPLDLVWYNSPAAAPAPAAEPERNVFEAGYAALGCKNSYLAVRSGHNSTNHAHLDLGTFVLDLAGTRVVCDLGRGDYAAAGYFDPERRFTHFPAQTRAHNVVFSGEQSRDAKAHVIVDERDIGRIAVEIVDPASPFRHLRGFQLGETFAIVADFISPIEPVAGAVSWQCHSALPIVMSAGEATFPGAGDGLRARLLSPAGHALALASVAADAEGFASISRLVAEFTVPAGGLFVACAFSNGHPERIPVDLSDWMMRVARDRWREVDAMAKGRSNG
jgi:hypothetical protein